MWLKIKLFFIRMKRYWWIAAMAVIMILIAWLTLCRPGASAYYYVDWNDNHGVATECWAEKTGLYCVRQYGGTVSVKQYCEIP